MPCLYEQIALTVVVLFCKACYANIKINKYIK